jgi:hypothetical protein
MRLRAWAGTSLEMEIIVVKKSMQEYWGRKRKKRIKDEG